MDSGICRKFRACSPCIERQALEARRATVWSGNWSATLVRSATAVATGDEAVVHGAGAPQAHRPLEMVRNPPVGAIGSDESSWVAVTVFTLEASPARSTSATRYRVRARPAACASSMFQFALVTPRSEPAWSGPPIGGVPSAPRRIAQAPRRASTEVATGPRRAQLPFRGRCDIGSGLGGRARFPSPTARALVCEGRRPPCGEAAWWFDFIGRSIDGERGGAGAKDT